MHIVSTVFSVTSVDVVRNLVSRDDRNGPRHFVVGMVIASRTKSGERSQAGAEIRQEWRGLNDSDKVRLAQEVQRLCEETVRILGRSRCAVARWGQYQQIEMLDLFLQECAFHDRTFGLLRTFTLPFRVFWRKQLTIRGQFPRIPWSSRVSSSLSMAA